MLAAEPDAGQLQRQVERTAEQAILAQQALGTTQVELERLHAEPAQPAAIDQLRHDLRVAHTEYVFRVAVRAEQQAIYWLAGHPDQEESLLALLDGPRTAGLADVAAGLRALWRHAHVADPGTMRVRYNHLFSEAEPVDELLGYYRSAAARQDIDWTYLAAINFIESGFGRNNGPSSAGALGPMQFLPSTWKEVGGGGDIMSPRDSIQAAALYLRSGGAPADYDRAIFRYNRNREYVNAVKLLAAAMRTDQAWLNRFYYWSTYG